MISLLAISTLAVWSVKATASSTHTNRCRYNQDSVEVSWTAFKSLKKVGVTGKLPRAKIMAGKGDSKLTILKGTTFEIDASKVESGDAARDIKIAQFFFKKMTGGPKISGKVTSVTEKKLAVELTMNGKTHSLDMPYSIEKGVFKATGGIHILNHFGMAKSFEAISKACSAKHEKKTWPDVLISVSAKVIDC